MKGFCVICNNEIDVNICCSGHLCCCMGLPTEPPVCSEECYNIFMNKRTNKLKEAMTEVKTIGDYINALPDDIREEVRRLNTPENGGEYEHLEIDLCTLGNPYLFEQPLSWMFSFPVGHWAKWEALAAKYTLTEKEGKYYTNW